MSDWNLLKADTETYMCNCIGPQPGQSLCPCMLRAEYQKEIALKERLIKEGWTPPNKGKKL